MIRSQMTNFVRRLCVILSSLIYLFNASYIVVVSVWSSVVSDSWAMWPWVLSSPPLPCPAVCGRSYTTPETWLHPHFRTRRTIFLPILLEHTPPPSSFVLPVSGHPLLTLQLLNPLAFNFLYAWVHPLLLDKHQPSSLSLSPLPPHNLPNMCIFNSAA